MQVRQKLPETFFIFPSLPPLSPLAEAQVAFLLQPYKCTCFLSCNPINALV